MMPATADYLAIDLGASGGRAMLGRFDGQRLALEEVHRFENGPVCVRGALYWDVLRLFEHIRAALSLCSQRGVRLEGVGVDTWGVDFGLLAGGELLTTPRHYRDPRNHGVMERVWRQTSRAEIYRRTGIQFLPFNTLYQLAAIRDTPILAAADRLLFMPDLLTYWLSGVAATEPSIAGTSQMLDPRTCRWDTALLEPLGLPARILPPVVGTGTVAGPLERELAEQTGQGGGAAAPRVIHTASHDTAAAVAAVPALRATGDSDDWAYISSGTWSLVGVELREPLINDATLAADFTNEVGVGRTIRFLKNVAGLWLVQECRRTWEAAGQPLSFAELTEQARRAATHRCFVDPDDPSFAEPGDMPARIRAFCQRTGQPVPHTPGEVVRCALESLALKYRVTVDTLERLTGRAIRRLHVVGGGSRDELLCQLTADATGREVVAGPAEATAAGNVLVQCLATGRLASPADIRAVMAQSAELRTHEPAGGAAWAGVLPRFETLVRRA